MAQVQYANQWSLWMTKWPSMLIIITLNKEYSHNYVNIPDLFSSINKTKMKIILCRWDQFPTPTGEKIFYKYYI